MGIEKKIWMDRVQGIYKSLLREEEEKKFQFMELIIKKQYM